MGAWTVILEVGETLKVQGSAPDPYLITNHGSYYSCSCPAWTFQRGRASERKACKHLRSLGIEALRKPNPPVRKPNPRVVVDREGREYEFGS